MNRHVTPDPWASLRTHTDARIGLGRCGTSLPLHESLAFKLAHARARDAVHTPMDCDKIHTELKQKGYPPLLLGSKAENRAEYLTRPDKGRQLSSESAQSIDGIQSNYDLSLVICDGLSSQAIHTSAVKVVTSFLDLVLQTDLTIAPLTLVTNGRVAIGDDIGHRLGARMVVVLIGERPGLSSPDSLGVYITINPRPGTTDESRNCISNIRPGGMTIEEGVRKISYLVEYGLQLGKTGIELKDMMGSEYLPLGGLITE